MAHVMQSMMHAQPPLHAGSSSLVLRPHPTGEGVCYLTSEFLVVLSQHVRKTGNPIRLLDIY